MLGICLCGKIEFEIDKENVKLYQCHCSLCRKQSGTYSNAATIVSSDSFRFLSGEIYITSWVKESGFRSDFCKCCGSPVPNPLRDMEYHWIPAGLLEDAGNLQIVSHLFVDSKASWAKGSNNVVEHMVFPESGIESHIRMLNE